MSAVVIVEEKRYSRGCGWRVEAVGGVVMVVVLSLEVAMFPYLGHHTGNYR